MSTIETVVIIAFAAAIHASFQLSVSVLTVMSGHALGKKTAHKRLLRLTSSFALGAMTMVTLMVSTLALLASNLGSTVPILAWSTTSGIVIGVGVAVWLFYFRYRSGGTVLWIPRPMADYLSNRARKTKIAPESFGLGLTSVIAESVFVIAPSLVAALVLAHAGTALQLGGLALYALIATLPMLVIVARLGAGNSLAVMQRWRERHKRFLQFSAGSALVILGIYIYSQTVITPIAEGIPL